MPTNVLPFPSAHPANTNAGTESQCPGAVISLTAWRKRTRARRTAGGVFFMTPVLTTTGDFA
ncbi:hypothetical protein [Maritimibacter sp. DP1N21-5]|uniref:hypothetical protein n=1 Tax=Maritimibacter sp. DP1N21-5 TaxID=2836867 RepID=UPI001C44E8EB|nr:hypothetical protein [Maritimibacter sp. DP1N21-5]MBV7407589.1 hypothetical protein [Maritimibacter sp. DP1N21-5]